MNAAGTSLDVGLGPTDTPAKPKLRGWIHAVTVPAAVGLGLMLIARAPNTGAKLSSGVFLATSVLLFGTSAIYHLVSWSHRTTVVLRRIDHSNIFLLIAGTYTPIAMTALAWPKSVITLVLMWSGAIMGIAFRVFWLSAPRWLYVGLYLALGWTALWFMGDLFTASPPGVAFLLVGGILYTIGAVVYGLRRPNIFPEVYGFHELFHTCTVLAFVLHWSAALAFTHAACQLP